MKKIIELYDWAKSEEEQPSNMVDHIHWLNKKLAEIPEESRASAELEISGCEYMLQYRIIYSREETLEEVQARQRENESLRANLRRLDLARLAELKAKYER